jgi:AraC family transcriptional activator FtrA
MTINDHIPPMRNRRVALLLYDGLCMFEFACAAEVFGLDRPEAGRDWYRFETVSNGGRAVRTQFGGRMQADGGLERLHTAGTIIIPGWQGADMPVPEPLVAALRAAHRRGSRLLSICSGVFVLAATGLLDGQRATTHWRYVERLRQRHRAIEVDADVLYVDNGQVLTSAGSAAGLDLCLHLVRRDFGSQKANLVARRLVIAPHRDGGQAQFVQQPVPSGRRDALAPLLDYLRTHLDQEHALAALAARVNMSERTFLRRFKSATGTSPGHWLTQARLQRACELLELTTLPMEEVARQSGVGSAITLRHHFRKRLGTSPGSYRRRFGAG